MSQIQAPPAWDDVATAYSTFLGDHLRLYAEDALNRLDVSRNDTVLDVATGPGTLALAAARLTHVWALDFSAGMLKMLRQNGTEAELANLTLTQGNGQGPALRRRYIRCCLLNVRSIHVS